MAAASRRGERADVDAADGEGHDEHHRTGAAERRHAFGHGGARTGRAKVRAIVREDGDGDDEERRQQQAGEEAGEQQPADRLLGEDAIDDERCARRDENPERAAGRDRAGRKAVIVLVALHLGQADLAHGDRRRDARSRDGGKAGAGHDRRGGKAAAPMADPCIGRAEQRTAHAGRRREIAHQHEQRNDREIVIGRVGIGIRAKGHQRLLRPVEYGESDAAHEQHGDADGHAQRQQAEHREDAEEADPFW